MEGVVIEELLKAPSLGHMREEWQKSVSSFKELREQYLEEETACNLLEALHDYLEKQSAESLRSTDAASLYTEEIEQRKQILKEAESIFGAAVRANRNLAAEAKGIIATTVDSYRHLLEIKVVHHQQSVQVARMADWYQQLNAIVSQLSGVSVLFFDEGRMHIKLVPRTHSEYSGPKPEEFLLSVIFSPETGRIQNLKINPSSVPHSDLVEMTTTLSDLPFFLQELHCRIGNILKREAERVVVENLCDFRSVGDGVHYTLSRREDGLGVTLMVDYDYPRPHSKPRVVENDAGDSISLLNIGSVHNSILDIAHALIQKE